MKWMQSNSILTVETSEIRQGNKKEREQKQKWMHGKARERKVVKNYKVICTMCSLEWWVFPWYSQFTPANIVCAISLFISSHSPEKNMTHFYYICYCQYFFHLCYTLLYLRNCTLSIFPKSIKYSILCFTVCIFLCSSFVLVLYYNLLHFNTHFMLHYARQASEITLLHFIWFMKISLKRRLIYNLLSLTSRVTLLGW